MQQGAEAGGQGITNAGGSEIRGTTKESQGLWTSEVRRFAKTQFISPRKGIPEEGRDVGRITKVKVSHGLPCPYGGLLIREEGDRRQTEGDPFEPSAIERCQNRRTFFSGGRRGENGK